MTVAAGTKPHPIFLAGRWVESPDVLVIDDPADPATPAGTTYTATEAQYDEAVEAAVGELSHEPAQGEVPLPAAPDQPVAMRAGDLLRLVTADLARRDAAGGCDPLQPVDRRAVADAETGRRLPTREPFLRHRRHDTLAKIHRISSTHPGWPPVQSRR